LDDPDSEADHSPLSSAEVKNVRSLTSTPPSRFHGVVLCYKKHRGTLPLVDDMGL